MDPFSAAVNLLLVLAMIPIMGFAMVWIVQRMIAGDTEPLIGLVAMALLTVMFAVAVCVPDQKMAAPILLIVVTSMAFFPYAETQLEKEESASVDSSRIDKAHRELAVRPNNVAARFELASALYDTGLKGHAIALAENTFEGLSSDRDVVSMESLRDKFRAEGARLARWKREPHDPKLFEPVKCPSCGTLNEPGSLECTTCKGAYILELARVKSDLRPVYRRLFFGFGLCSVLFISCVWASTSLKWPMSGIGIGGAIVTVGALMSWIFRPRTLRN